MIFIVICGLVTQNVVAWTRHVRTFHLYFRKFFRVWGRLCVNHTKTVIFIGIIILLLCDMGFLNFRFEGDVNASFTYYTKNRENRDWYLISV